MDDNSDQIGKPPPNEKGSVNDGVKEVIHNQEDVTALEKVTEIIKNIALIGNGAAKKPTINDKTTRKPPILTVESVRTLLEHRFHMILSKKVNDLNYLKYLFVSKVFFNVARRYPIFCLVVGYLSKEVGLTCGNLSLFKLPIIEQNFKVSNVIFLSYEKMSSLLSMLKPNHFLMFFDDSDVSNETLMNAIGHLDLAPGKTVLKLKGNFQTDLSLLLDHFSHRKLEFLEGSSDFLTHSNVKLKIGHFVTPSPMNSVQLHEILSHNLDSLVCKVGDSFIDEAASLSSLNSGNCNSLKWLHVCCNESYDSLMAFLDVVKDKCQKLKELRIGVAISRANDSSILRVSDTDDILNQIPYVKGKIQKIVEKCRPLTSSLNVRSVMPVYYDSTDEFSCNWIDRAKTMDWFKDSVHEELVEQVGNRSFNICQLSSKFCNGFLELDNETKIYRFALQ